MARIKNYIHCLTCRRFIKCQIKFLPQENPIFTSYDFGKDEKGADCIILSKPVKCSRPLKSK